MRTNKISKKLATISLEIGSIKFCPDQPFLWASGHKMPLYNDNRLLLGGAANRTLIAKGFNDLIERHNIVADVIAGTATAGIPHATTLADLLQLPLIYVRSAVKSHGMGKQIEGPLNQGRKVLLIEDLISTGGSAVKAIKAIREAGGIVNDCLSIFSYGFNESAKKFQDASCRTYSILSFPQLLEVAQATQNISPNDIVSLKSWQKDPFKWSENKGL